MVTCFRICVTSASWDLTFSLVRQQGMKLYCKNMPKNCRKNVWKQRYYTTHFFGWTFETSSWPWLQHLGFFVFPRTMKVSFLETSASKQKNTVMRYFASLRLLSLTNCLPSYSPIYVFWGNNWNNVDLPELIRIVDFQTPVVYNVCQMFYSISTSSIWWHSFKPLVLLIALTHVV